MTPRSLQEHPAWRDGIADFNDGVPREQCAWVGAEAVAAWRAGWDSAHDVVTTAVEELPSSGRTFRCPVCGREDTPPAEILAMAPKGPICYGPVGCDEADEHRVVPMVEVVE